MTHIFKDYTLTTPDDFTPVDLPGRDKWLEALKSGEFKKGKWYLCNQNKEYCCLGVLSKIQGRLLFSDNEPLHIGLDLNSDYGGLSKSNPLYGQLSSLGTFPPRCSVKGAGINYCDCLAIVNDKEDSFDVVIWLIETLWKEPS